MNSDESPGRTFRWLLIPATLLAAGYAIYVTASVGAYTFTAVFVILLLGFLYAEVMASQWGGSGAR